MQNSPRGSLWVLSLSLAIGLAPYCQSQQHTQDPERQHSCVSKADNLNNWSVLDGFALAQTSQHHHHQRGWLIWSFQMPQRQIPLVIAMCRFSIILKESRLCHPSSLLTKTNAENPDLASFAKSPSTSSRFPMTFAGWMILDVLPMAHRTSPSFTAACASKRFLLAKSWIWATLSIAESCTVTTLTHDLLWL